MVGGSHFEYQVGPIHGVKNTPEHINDVVAILQHYGIPTQFIDFTTDPGVAAFFAADTADPPAEGMSCIYCLDTDDLMSVWESIKHFDDRKGAIIELVTIDVKNLWRLQSQKGVFLLSDYNWDIDYAMDRILFPYSGYPSYPTRERIYPEHKSPLEQLLDQFFFLVSETFWGEWMEQFIVKERGGTHVRYETFPDGFFAQAFINPSQMDSHESWNLEAIRRWEIDPVEDYQQTIGYLQKLNLKPQASAEEIKSSVSFGVKQIIRSDPTIHSKAVDWEFTGLPESLSPEELNNMLRLVWNGMRRLPYTSDEIADAFGSVLALQLLGFRREVYDSTIQMKLFSQCFSECMLIDFGYQDGSASRGYVARKSLLRALRPDLEDLLVPKYKKYVNDVNDLIHIIYGSPPLNGGSSQSDFAGSSSRSLWQRWIGNRSRARSSSWPFGCSWIRNE